VEEFQEDIDGFRIRIVSKPEESRAFFQVVGKLIQPDDKRKNPEVAPRITAQDEQNAVLAARQWYEASFNVMFIRFAKDPMAGGLRPAKPVSEQVTRQGYRFPRIRTANSQEFPPVHTDDRGVAIPEFVQGNTSSDTEIMLSTPMWAGQW
jgi:hypothetical protein